MHSHMYVTRRGNGAVVTVSFQATVDLDNNQVLSTCGISGIDYHTGSYSSIKLYMSTHLLPSLLKSFCMNL